ncbi:hypothetical protein HGRIS_000148 [Hohenbuehelia grisea]|uniref:Uncharacterized protein n=1 Tax=Hohenbuehelia grisea TaxID=104357 RepID=A0ABR3JSA1_9AGAR
MTLGCAFIFVAVLWCCRRRARKRRMASGGGHLGQQQQRQQRGWRWRLLRLGERIFGHTPTRVVARRRGHASWAAARESDAAKLQRLRDAEEARAEQDYDRYHSYGYSYPPPQPQRAPTGWRLRLLRLGERFFGHTPSRVVVVGNAHSPSMPTPTRTASGRPVHISAPVPLQSEALAALKRERERDAEEARAKQDYDQLLEQYDYPRPDDEALEPPRRLRDSVGSAPSMYSQMTGMPRRGPDPRQPVKAGVYSKLRK